MFLVYTTSRQNEHCKMKTSGDKENTSYGKWKAARLKEYL